MPQHTGHDMKSMMSADMQACIDDCMRCTDVCTQTAQHCLGMGGEHARPEHIATMLDCVDICATSARFMGRGSKLHASVCRVCAEACRACEKECRRLGADDAMMKQCAEACRRCAESCERMATM